MLWRYLQFLDAYRRVSCSRAVLLLRSHFYVTWKYSCWENSLRAKYQRFYLVDFVLSQEYFFLSVPISSTPLSELLVGIRLNLRCRLSYKCLLHLIFAKWHGLEIKSIARSLFCCTVPLTIERLHKASHEHKTISLEVPRSRKCSLSSVFFVFKVFCVWLTSGCIDKFKGLCY